MKEGDLDSEPVTIRRAGKKFVIMAGNFRLGVQNPEEIVDDVGRLSQTALKLQTSENELSDAIFAYLEAEGKRRKHKTVPFWANGQVYEAIAKVDGSAVFVSYDGSYKIVEEIEEPGFVIVPQKPGDGAYVFDDDIENLKVPDIRDLYRRVLQMVTDFFSHPDKRTSKFLSVMLLHSYVLTRSIGTLFLWLVGPKRAGKTTFQTIVERLGYRVFSGTHPTASTIYRTLGKDVEYGPTIVIREYSWANETMRELAREGDIPGATKPVTEQLPNGEFVVVSYKLYGWRVVGSNTLHGDLPDLDRYFVLRVMHMRPPKPRSMLHRDKETQEVLLKLRNDLLLWKVAKTKSLAFPFEDPENTLLDRDWEHFGGVLTLAKEIDPDLAKELRDYVQEYIEERDEDEAGGTYSVLLESVQELATKTNEFGDGYRVAFKDIWAQVEHRTTEGADKKGNPVRVTPSGETLTTTKAGRLLKEQLMGRPTKWGGTTRGYVWSNEIIRMLDASFRTGWTGLGSQGPEKQGRLQENETALQLDKEPVSQAQGPVQPVQPVKTDSTDPDRALTRSELVAEVQEARGEKFIRCRVHNSWHRYPQIWNKHLAADHKEVSSR